MVVVTQGNCSVVNSCTPKEFGFSSTKVAKQLSELSDFKKACSRIICRLVLLIRLMLNQKMSEILM